MQSKCGTRILRVIHGRDARATFPNCTYLFAEIIYLIARKPCFTKMA